MNWTDEEDESEHNEFGYDYEAQTHSHFTMQSGRAEVGRNDEGGESKRVSVGFEMAFSEDGPVPMVFVQVEGEIGSSHVDVLAATIVETRHDGFEVNVGRPGKRAWGQNVVLNYIAIIAVDHPMVSTIDVQVGRCEGGSRTCEVVFDAPLPMGQSPFLMATVVGEDHPDCFSVTLKKLTRHNASFTVSRIREHGAGWGQVVRLNICYFAQGLFPTFRVDVGNSEENRLVIEDLPWGMQLRRRPLPFVMVQHPNGASPDWGDSFVTTITNVQRDTMQMNVMRTDRNAGWGMQARAVIALVP